MLDLTHGAMVAGERIFVFGGESQPYYEWEECGLVVHVPEYGVPPLSTCEMRVSALAGGDFIFPDGHELVSAVYAVTFSHSLQKDVVLDLQHCVDLQLEEHTDCLSFAVASPLPSPGSYIFSLVKGGRFSVRDRYGSIVASMSLCYCILMSEYALNKKRENSNKKPSGGTKHDQEDCNDDYQFGKEDSDSSCGSGGEAGAAGSDGSSEESYSKDHSSDEKSESEEDDDNTSEEEVESNESSEDKQDAKQKIQQSSENQAHVKPETSSEENIELESRPTFKDELKTERMGDQFSNTKVHLDPSGKSENLFSDENEKMEGSLENDHQRQKRQHEKLVHHDTLVRSRNISERHSSNTDEHRNTNKLYYVCQTLVVKDLARCWVVKAVFAKDLKVLKNYMKRNSTSDMMKEGIIVIFHFKEEYLILNVLPMTKHGWNVVPLVQHPYKIYQKSIDSFGARKFQEPVLSVYEAFAESDAERVLEYPLMITGVEETGLTLNIVIDGYDPRMDSATALTEKHECTDNTATRTSVLDKKPSLKDACNVLRDQSAEWDDIGLQLDVPFDVREEWHKDGSLTNKQRLQRVINRWLVSDCHSAVTWSGLINILKQSDYISTAKKIESFLKTEYAQEHYKSL